jgi:hypothetical protein
MTGDAPKRPMSLLAVMSKRPDAEEAPSLSAPEDEPEVSADASVPEPKLLAAEGVAQALRGGSAEGVARALDRYLRVVRYMED